MASCQESISSCQASVHFPTLQDVQQDHPTQSPTEPTGGSGIGIVGSTRVVQLELTLVRLNISGEASGREMKPNSAFVLQPTWESVIGNLAEALGVCPSKVSFNLAEEICTTALDPDPTFVPTATYPEYSWVCSAEEAYATPSQSASCAASGSYIWTSTSCTTADDRAGRIRVPRRAACGRGDCQASYPGERCWHDGRKRKSCKESWENRGVFREGIFVNTMTLCHMCADDEDCRLFVYQGVFPVDEPLYTFNGNVIPAEKRPGVCGLDGLPCGDADNMTVEASPACTSTDAFIGNSFMLVIRMSFVKSWTVHAQTLTHLMTS